MSNDRTRWEDQNSRFAEGYNVTHGDIGEAQRERINEGLKKANKSLIAIEKASRKKLDTAEDGTEVYGAPDEEVRTILREELRGYALQNGFYEVNQNLEGLQAGIDELNQTAYANSEQLAELTDIAYETRNELIDLNATGDAILERVGDIEANTEEIISSLDRVNDGLDTLVDLAMDSIKQQRKTRKTITGLFGRMLVFLESSKGQFLTHLKRIQYHQLATRNILADIAEIGLETNRKLDRNMIDQRRIAENAETFKVRHYCNEGKKLIRTGHYEEAIVSLNDAYACGRTDFETNYLLAQVYSVRGDKENGQKHLSLAQSFAATDAQCLSCALFVAERYLIEGDKEALTKHIIRTFQSNPSIHLSPEWRRIMTKAGAEEQITDYVCSNNDGRPDHVAIWMMRDLKRRYFEDELWQYIWLTNEPDLSGAFREAMFGTVMDDPFLRREAFNIINQSIVILPSDLILKWARKYMATGDLTPRSWLTHIYRHDAKIREMQNNRDYDGIAAYFKSALGEEASRLKNFGDLPERIRKLL